MRKDPALIVDQAAPQVCVPRTQSELINTGYDRSTIRRDATLLLACRP